MGLKIERLRWMDREKRGRFKMEEQKHPPSVAIMKTGQNQKKMCSFLTSPPYSSQVFQSLSCVCAEPLHPARNLRCSSQLQPSHHWWQCASASRSGFLRLPWSRYRQVFRWGRRRRLHWYRYPRHEWIREYQHQLVKEAATLARIDIGTKGGRKKKRTD